jgi:hypothetical protein
MGKWPEDADPADADAGADPSDGGQLLLELRFGFRVELAANVAWTASFQVGPRIKSAMNGLK